MDGNGQKDCFELMCSWRNEKFPALAGCQEIRVAVDETLDKASPAMRDAALVDRMAYDSYTFDNLSRILSPVSSAAARINNLLFQDRAELDQQFLERLKSEVNCLGNSLHDFMTDWEWLLLIYRADDALGSAKSLPNVLNSILQGLSKVESGVHQTEQQISDSRQSTVAAMAQSTESSIQAMSDSVKTATLALTNELADAKQKLADAKDASIRYQQECKEQADEAYKHYQNQAMAAFGAHFKGEAETAANMAKHAGKWAIGAVIALIVSIVGLIVLEQFFPSKTWIDIAKWSWMKLVWIGLLTWFIAHFFRQERNFLHVSVANRHRANLCNSYINIAEKMPERVKLHYLKVILPEVAPLGKTGFIVKEEVPDIAMSPAVKAALETVQKFGTSGK